ncbi:MAG: hypothetical protein D6692_05245 [Planctomycetota bacterium]|nr:MAG: hypothetical protein D6692_05245 [Planctomycetota bacterium]
MTGDPVWGPVARAMITAPPPALRAVPAPLKIWGRPGEDIEQTSVDQALKACELPISVVGALMPGAHLGYWLPIDGAKSPLDTVVVVGTVGPRPNAGVLTVRATGIHRTGD